MRLTITSAWSRMRPRERRCGGILPAGRLPSTNPNVFCCPLLVQVPGAQFSWLERLPLTQEVAGSSPVAPANSKHDI